MPNDPLNLQIEQLVERAKQMGSVSYRELDELLPVDHEDEKEFGDILLAVQGAEIEICHEPPLTPAKSSAPKPLSDDDQLFGGEPMELYLRELRSIPPVTRAHEMELSGRIHAGGPGAESMRKELVEANLEMVVSLAEQYGNPQVDIVTRVQDGNSYLSSAAGSCDFGRGYRFSTYANWRVYRAFRRANESS